MLPSNYMHNSPPYLTGTELLASASRVASGVSDGQSGFGWAKTYQFVLDVTETNDAAADTLNVYIQRRLPNGDWDDVVAFTQIAGDGGATTIFADVSHDETASFLDTVDDGDLMAGSVKKVYIGDWLRVKWVIVDDTDPDFTFSVWVAAVA